MDGTCSPCGFWPACSAWHPSPPARYSSTTAFSLSHNYSSSSAVTITHGTVYPDPRSHDTSSTPLRAPSRMSSTARSCLLGIPIVTARSLGGPNRAVYGTLVLFDLRPTGGWRVTNHRSRHVRQSGDRPAPGHSRDPSRCRTPLLRYRFRATRPECCCALARPATQQMFSRSPCLPFTSSRYSRTSVQVASGLYSCIALASSVVRGPRSFWYTLP